MQPEHVQQEDQVKVEEPVEATEPRVNPRKSVFVCEYDWKLDSFDEGETLKKFSELGNLEINPHQFEKTKGILMAVQSAQKGSALGKYTAFIIRGIGPDSTSIEIIRKSADFLALRDALVRRWPSIIIPPFPDKLAVGVTDAQINKNRLKFVNNLLKRLCLLEPLYRSEQMEIFLGGQESQIVKALEKLKPHKPHELLKKYSESFPNYFGEHRSEENLIDIQAKIKNIEEYLLQAKTDLCYQKDQFKKLAQLKDKMLQEKYRVLSKFLPGYEDICLDWFEITKLRSSIKSTIQKDEQETVGNKIYGSRKYQAILQGYQGELFNEQGVSSAWGLYELFKFELKQIDALHQAITQYKFLNNERKYYQRNVENSKKQIQDISNNKTSLKIMFLSGSTEEKKTQLTNEKQYLENELEIVQDLWSGTSEMMLDEIKTFMRERTSEYKEGTRLKFQNQVVFMGKILNMYVEAKKLS